MGCNDVCTCGDDDEHRHFGDFKVSPGPNGYTGIILDNFIGPIFTPDDAA